MTIIDRTQFLLNRYKNDPESITDAEFTELINNVEEVQVRFALSARVMASAARVNSAAMKEMIAHMGSMAVQLDKTIEVWRQLGELDAKAKATFIEVKEDEEELIEEEWPLDKDPLSDHGIVKINPGEVDPYTGKMLSEENVSEDEAIDDV